MNPAPDTQQPLQDPWQEEMERLTQILKELIELEEGRQFLKDEDLFATLTAYLQTKKKLVQAVEDLLRGGLLETIEDKVQSLNPPSARRHFLQVLAAIRHQLRRTWELHVQNLQQARDQSQGFRRALEEIHQTLAYLRAYPLNARQSVRVNITG